jgi:hypothetical protein
MKKHDLEESPLGVLTILFSTVEWGLELNIRARKKTKIKWRGLSDVLLFVLKITYFTFVLLLMKFH